MGYDKTFGGCWKAYAWVILQMSKRLSEYLCVALAVMDVGASPAGHTNYFADEASDALFVMLTAVWILVALCLLFM